MRAIWSRLGPNNTGWNSMMKRGDSRAPWIRVAAGVLGLAAGVALAVHGVGWLGGATANADAASPGSAVTVSKSGYDLTPLTKEQVAERAKSLTEEQRQILLARGTEVAFCGGHLENKLEGTYTCALCGLPLFRSDTKFESGTGWPSFHSPFDKDHIRTIADRSHGMARTEIRCARCDGHLGHLFDDGPAPTGLRYCLNSAALDFHETGKPLPPESMPVQWETAFFAGGCFWGIEDAFQRYPGVKEAVSGYMGGHVREPDYHQVCSEDTGHAETVKVVFDPKKVSYQKLLEFFFHIHDPTTLNRQGPDVGKQYRSAIFAADDSQAKAARAQIAALQAQRGSGASPIVTEVNTGGTFWAAEDYHQDYNARHGRKCHADVEQYLPAKPTE